MSAQNVETVRRGFEHFRATGAVRDGKQIRMEMYSDPAEGLEAAGLAH